MLSVNSRFADVRYVFSLESLSLKLLLVSVGWIAEGGVLEKSQGYAA